MQNVIANTTTPTWVNHVPKNFGEKGAGSIKADEWRLLATIYLPIALVLLWAEQTGNDAAHFSRLLQHSMALFQATTIISRYSTSSARTTAYRNFIKFLAWKPPNVVSSYNHSENEDKSSRGDALV